MAVKRMTTIYETERRIIKAARKLNAHMRELGKKRNLSDDEAQWRRNKIMDIEKVICDAAQELEGLTDGK